MPEMVDVIDMSAAQPAIVDFGKAKSAVMAAWFKATDGVNDIDAHFFNYATQAKVAGFLFSAYHYFHVRAGKGANGQDGAQQADDFCNAVLKAGCTIKYVMVDVEAAMNTVDMHGNRLPIQPTKDEWRAGLNQFITRVKARLGISDSFIIIYTSNGEWDSFGLTDCTEFASNTLWIADVRGRTAPEVPKPWTDWTIWQYSWSGQIPGIAGNVDKSHFKGDADAFNAWLGQSSTLSSVLKIGGFAGVLYGLWRLWHLLGK